MVNDIPLPLMTFTEYDDLDDQVVLEVAPQVGKNYYLLSQLRDLECLEVYSKNGEEYNRLNDAGVPVVNPEKVNPNNINVIPQQNVYSEFNIEGSFNIIDPVTFNPETPFSKIIDQWIPVPMFYLDSDNDSRTTYPSAWCRLKISLITSGKNGVNRYRFTWAFDTTLANEYDVDEGEDPENQMLPYFKSNTHKHEFGLPTQVTHLIQFMRDNSWVGDYLANLIFGEEPSTIKLTGGFMSHCRHKAYYISLFTQLRVLGAFPQVILYNCDKEQIPVDLVLDIGNSRTCGVLYENCDFSLSSMLSLRDLTNPHVVHTGSFDMRMAFRKAEFGRNNMDHSSVFQWRSFVRLGVEAQKLISQSFTNIGNSDKWTHHSSPKRFLWDGEQFNGQWEFIQTEGESIGVQADGVYIERLSEQLKSDGSFRQQSDAPDDNNSSYSRKSLMTFAFIEIFQQALCQINSYDYTNVVTGRGREDVRRYLRRVIVTCPTAFSQEEQLALRQCAGDAFIAIERSHNPNVVHEKYDSEYWKEQLKIVPSVEDLALITPIQIRDKVEWGYDEATCCQMVYLYSEIVSKYNGNSTKFFANKGHKRLDLQVDGVENQNTLTVGSIDIGAGTTDLMICSYINNQSADKCTLTPVPLFWDSFNVAGDDIVHEMIYKMVIGGVADSYKLGYGSIYNEICARRIDAEYGGSVDDKEKLLVEDYAKERVMSYFAEDMHSMSYLDRVMRTDFNVQISVPLVGKMLDMMKNGEKPGSVTYEEIFADIAPSASLLNHFEEKFGFRFESLKWDYSPERISGCIRTKMEKLLKQLSIILHSFNCDVVLLAGRPMSLQAVTDLFLKYFPVSPDRLIRLLPKNESAISQDALHNSYCVGRWFPAADPEGYFKDLKPVVAAGAMVAYLGSHGELSKFQLDMKHMKQRMSSTAKYLGVYEESRGIIQSENVLLTPEQSTATFVVEGLPLYIGCKQLNSNYYQARPLIAITLKPNQDVSYYDLSRIRMTLTRVYVNDKEKVELLNAFDKNNNDVTSVLQVKIQTIIMENGVNTYWMDNGVFEF